MVLQLITALFLIPAFTLSTELDFTPCFGTSFFVEPPSTVSSEICKLNNISRPATNFCELYEHDRFILTFEVEKTVCMLNVEVTASAVDEKYLNLDDYANFDLPANITADHDLNKYYVFVDIRDLPMRPLNFCFVFRGNAFRNASEPHRWIIASIPVTLIDEVGKDIVCAHFEAGDKKHYRRRRPKMPDLESTVNPDDYRESSWKWEFKLVCFSNDYPKEYKVKCLKPHLLIGIVRFW